MNTFFGNFLAASLAFVCVLWFQWQHVEEKIDGMADKYGAPVSVQRVAVAPAASAAPENGAQTAVPASSAP